MLKRRMLMTSAGLATVPAMAAPASGPAQVIEAFAATLNAHDIAGFGTLFAEGYVNHQQTAAAPTPVGISAKQATVDFFAARLQGLPDLVVEVEVSMVSEDKGAASFVYTSTHNGPYLGFAPTRKRVRFTSCDVFRVVDGRIAEHWGMGDLAGLLAQLRR